MSVADAPVRLLCPVPRDQAETALALYLEAFWPKLRLALGDRARAKALFRPRLARERGIAAVAEGHLLGVAGFQQGGSFLDADWADFRRVYGPRMGLACAALLSLYDRSPRPGEFVMDGLAVAREARGRGIGTALLAAVEARARAARAHALRLDVVDSNARARALYERLGFHPVGRRRYRLTGPLVGFSAAIEMRKPLS